MQHIEPVIFEPPNPHKKITPQSRSLISRLIILISCVFLIVIIWFLFTTKSIHLIVEPGNAIITIQTPFKLALADRYLLRKNSYNIEISAEGYHVLKDVLTVEDKQNQEFSYKLDPLPGHLQVNATNVNEAKVFLDGIEQGLVPMKVNDIEAGTHQLGIVAERYFPYEQTIEIKGKGITQDLNIELIPAWAEVKFASTPETADILINDEKLSSTPSTLELLQGKYSIRIKKSGFKDWQNTIDVIASEPLAFTDIKLKPADATLFIESDPNGANVTIDGDYAGKTPLEVAITPGKKSSVRLYKQGFVSKTNNVNVAAGQSERLNIKMSTELVEVMFNLQPTDAKLYIDNKIVQLSGTTLALSTTQHTISVSKEGYVDYKTTITPIEGVPQQVNVTLKSLKQQKMENIKQLIKTSAGQELKLFNPYKFTMGASRREPGRRANEMIQTVELKRPFYLSINEITNNEFSLFKASHSSGSLQGHSMNNGTQPVANISWEEAALYCNWLSQKESFQPFYIIKNNKVSGFNARADGYRLPTEAEWEWAARSVNESDSLKFPWGDKMPPPKKSGNYADMNASGFLGKTINNYNDGFAVSAPVGSFAPNHNGLYDMGGNVAEWVHDYYSVQASNNRIAVDPLGPVKGEFHVVRGASWAHGTITELRLSYRDYTDKPREDVGFRIARYLD
jgi:formylglycine-generating enzyme required for sulfatase activity